MISESLRRRGAGWLASMAAWSALATGLPGAALAQGTADLPRLGAAAGDELTPAAERRLGEQVMRDLRRSGDVLDDAELTDWLGAFGATLAGTNAAAGLDLGFFLVRDPTINAFALPGGYVGVHTGLIVAAQTESQLASVLAHEVGHVAQRHIARMLSQQRQSSMLALAGMVLGALAARGGGGDAFMGLATLGGSVAQQQMLSFSRDAEREADRVGFEMLQQGGFDANGMVEFFGRLQQSGRIRESNAPAYLRTHPLTSERIADMQSRIRDARYRQRPDRMDFRLVRAKLRALQDDSVDGLAAARTYFAQLQQGGAASDSVPWYGAAVAAGAQRDIAAAERALAEARRRLPAGHPFFDRLAIELRQAAGDTAGALQLAQAARARFPDSRAIGRQTARARLAAGDARAAAALLREQLTLWRSDRVLWELLAEAHAALGEPALAHRAAAEGFVVAGALPAAVEQLQLAQRAGGLDFITASTIDARLRELREAAAEEQRAQRGR